MISKKTSGRSREKRESFTLPPTRTMCVVILTEKNEASFDNASLLYSNGALHHTHIIFCGAMQERGPLFSAEKNKGSGWKLATGVNCNISGPGQGKTSRKKTKEMEQKRTTQRMGLKTHRGTQWSQGWNNNWEFACMQSMRVFLLEYNLNEPCVLRD